MKQEDFFNELSSFTEVKIIGPMPLQQALVITGPTIYVDGGIQHRPSAQHANITIGDDDSNKTSVELDICLRKDKDLSDLTYVLKLIPENITRIEFLGFLGGRLDHQMIVLGSIYHFLKSTKQATSCCLENTIIASSHKTITFTHKGTFSLMSLEKQEVSITGECRYQIQEARELDVLSCLTLSNVAYGEVTIESTKPLFIYLLR